MVLETIYVVRHGVSLTGVRLNVFRDFIGSHRWLESAHEHLQDSEKDFD